MATLELAPPSGAKAPAGASSNDRIPALDGLRGIAILAVMLFHFKLYAFGEAGTLAERIYSTVLGLGWAGVDLFFVLSGFLITGILYDSRGQPSYYRVFYARRTVRIFPLYYAALAALFFAIPHGLKLLERERAMLDLLEHATPWFSWVYLLNWPMGVYGFATVPGIMQHLWSLSVEEQFYLVWPGVVRNLPRRRLMVLCAGLVTGAVALRILCHLLDRPEGAYLWTFCRTDSLGIGALIALAMRGPADRLTLERYARPVAMAAAAGLVGVVAWAGTTATGGFWMDTFGILLLAILSGGCLALCLGSPAGNLLAKAMSSPVLRFFGRYSYGLYICHQPVLVALTKSGAVSDRWAGVFHGKIPAMMAINALGLLLASGAALASWHLLEKHFLKLKDRPMFQYSPLNG